MGPTLLLSVRVRGQVHEDGRVFCVVYTDTETVGQIEDCRHWDLADGWVLRGLLSEEE